MFGRELCVALMPFWNTFRASVLLRNTFILGFDLLRLYFVQYYTVVLTRGLSKKNKLLPELGFSFCLFLRLREFLAQP